MENLFRDMKRIVIGWYVMLGLVILTYPIIMIAMAFIESYNDILVILGYGIIILLFIVVIVLGIALMYLYNKVGKALTQYIMDSEEFEDKKIGYMTMRYSMYRPTYHKLFRSKSEEHFKDNLGKITTRIIIKDYDEE